MPKTAKNLWSKVVDWENLYTALHAASRGKRFHNGIIQFNANALANLAEVQSDLIAGTWMPKEYRVKEVFRPKHRIIHAPAFKDRVVHHALVQVIGPLIEKKFYAHSYACQKGKGPCNASAYLLSMLKKSVSTYPRIYALKADVSKYFASIDHEILYKLICRYIRDPNVLSIIWKLITSGPTRIRKQDFHSAA